MQVTIVVSDEIVRQAGVRGLPVIDFVEAMIDKGIASTVERPVLSSAIDRIKALHAATAAASSMPRKP
jgi:hypothetical protein